MGGLVFAFESRYPGIAIQAVLVTACVFAVMLMLYSDGCAFTSTRMLTSAWQTRIQTRGNIGLDLGCLQVASVRRENQRGDSTE